MPKKNFENIRKMGAKFVIITLAIYKRTERKILPLYFTSCIVDVHPYKKFFTDSLKISQVRMGNAEKRMSVSLDP